MSLPVLALLTTRRTPDALLPLLAALTRYCKPTVPDVAVGSAVAALCTDPHVAPLPGVPIAVWVDDVDQLKGPRALAATVVLTRNEKVLDAVGGRACWVPLDRLAGDRRPISPYVRGRLRAARQLPADALAVQPEGAPGGRLCWQSAGRPAWIAGGRLPADELVADPLINDDLTETALACAAAVVVTEPTLTLSALAWGAPTVTTVEAANRLGARPGLHCLVAASGPDRLRLAREVLADSDLSSDLAWAGRLFVEQRYDLDRAAATVARRLGLSLGVGPHARTQALLAELGTPPDARIRGRLSSFIAPLRPPASPPSTSRSLS